jgi:hypothetical protein
VRNKAYREKILREIAENIGAPTGGHLDLVIVTHEHTDHINGFGLASDIFGSLTVDRVWMAWTENPDDSLVKKIRKKIDGSTRILLRVAGSRLYAGYEDDASAIDALLAYSGSNKASIKTIRDMKNIEYLRQGQGPLELLEMAGVRFYVLSPTYDYKFIMKRPKKDPEDIYEISGMPLSAENSMLTAALEVAHRRVEKECEEDRAFREELGEPSQPFDARYRIEKKDLRAMGCADFFNTHYGLSGRQRKGAIWRQIERDWARMAELLAINLNHTVNNTSLVIAVELIESGQVLLFSGDAQAESWHSWYDNDIEWKVDGEKVPAKDLLERTVFYKANHHGSHNGTVKSRGLELMDESRLVAMVPVGRNNKFNHPSPKVLEALMTKARKRVIR